MIQPETALHRTKNFGKGKSKETQRSESAKTHAIPQKIQTDPVKKRTTPLKNPQTINKKY